MKNTRNSKNIFIKISKICLILFFIALVILIVFGMATKSEEVVLPTILGIFFLLSTVASLICIVIAWILDLIESVRRDKFSCLAGYVIWIVVLWAAVVAIDYLFRSADVDWRSSLVQAAISVCVIRAADYIVVRKK